MLAPPRPPSHDDAEALIKEARERQLRRRLLRAAGVVIAAALGLSAYAILSAGAQRPSTASGVRPSASTAPCGVAGGWRLKFGPLWSEPTGQHTAPIVVTRVGASACQLSGYPAVALLDARRRTLGFRYSHRGDQ